MSPKLAEFYRRAEEDPAFRRKQIAEQRYTRRVLLGCGLLIACLCAAQGVYDGLTGEGWLNWNELTGLGWVSFGAWMHRTTTRRIAVLEAMDGATGRILESPSPGED